MSGDGRRCDVAVIGGGIVGALTAWRLQAAGCQVVLLDRQYLSGATAASAAVLRALCDEPARAARGLAWYRWWSDTMPPARAPLRQCGVLVVTPPDAMPAALAANRILAAHQASARRCDQGRCPAGYDPGPGAPWLEACSGYAEPRLMLRSLLSAFQAAGGTVRRAKVRRLYRARGGWRLLTDAGPAEAGAAVVAAGSATPGLLPDPSSRQPVTRLPVSTASFAVRPGAGWLTRFPAVVDLHHGLLLRPASGGILGTLRTAGSGQRFLDELATVAAARLPGLRAIRPRLLTVSEFDVTGDGQPFIGPVDDRLFAAYGLNGRGFKLAPALTEEIAGMVTTGRVTEQMRCFDPLRRAAVGPAPLGALA